MAAFDYDLIVIGGGAAGLTAAGMSALLGAKTLLVERHKLGGDCTWVGCVPSKTLLRAAKLAHQIRTANRYGITSSEPQVDFAQVMHHVRQTRQHIYDEADAPPRIEALGAEVLFGSAQFLNPHEIQLTDTDGHSRRISARFFIIATGSRPRLPWFDAQVLTNESVFELTTRPDHLLVIGGGPIGIELAQAFRRLGSRVTVVVEGDLILPRDDPDHAQMLQQFLIEEGIEFAIGRHVTALDKNEAVLDDGRTISCDAALAAIGRQPITEGLQLEQAGVHVTKQGIVTDRRCRTSQAHIYAVGDVNGRYQFTHMAEHMSKVAITNALLRWPKSIDEKNVVWCTFTDPELAHIGESEVQLRKRQAKFTVLRFPFRQLDRAITEGEPNGEVKVFAAAKSGRILGASILGANAGEMIAEYALAMRNRLRASQIADTVHPYPTFALGNRRAADQFVEKQLDSRLLGLLGRLFRYRGTRRGSAALRDN